MAVRSHKLSDASAPSMLGSTTYMASKKTTTAKRRAIKPGSADQVVQQALDDWYADNLPPKAEVIDIRKISDPKWASLVMYFGTTEAFAAFIGSTAMTVGRWIKEESKPSTFQVFVIRAIAKACNVESPI